MKPNPKRRTDGLRAEPFFWPGGLFIHANLPVLLWEAIRPLRVSYSSPQVLLLFISWLWFGSKRLLLFVRTHGAVCTLGLGCRRAPHSSAYFGYCIRESY